MADNMTTNNTTTCPETTRFDSWHSSICGRPLSPTLQLGEPPMCARHLAGWRRRKANHAARVDGVAERQAVSARLKAVLELLEIPAYFRGESFLGDQHTVQIGAQHFETLAVVLEAFESVQTSSNPTGEGAP